MAIEFKSPTVAKNTITDRLEKQGREAKLQEKSVEYTENNNYQVLPDEGFDGMTKVNVSVDVAVPTVQNSKTVNINTNGTQTISPDNGYDVVEQVVVNTNVQPNLQEKTVNVLLTDTSTNIQPDSGFDGMSAVTVNHPPVESNTAYTATSNGSYTIHPSEGFDATTSVNLTVNVTNPSTAYDINNEFVSLAYNKNITQAKIDSIAGWTTLKDGSNKLASAKLADYNYFITMDLPEITTADNMFSGVSSTGIRFTDRSFKKLTRGQDMFDTNNRYMHPTEDLRIHLDNIIFDSLTDGERLLDNCYNEVVISDSCFPNVTKGSHMFSGATISSTSGAIYLPNLIDTDHLLYKCKTENIVIKLPKVTSLYSLASCSYYDGLIKTIDITIDQTESDVDINRVCMYQNNLTSVNIHTASNVGIYDGDKRNAFNGCTSLADFNANRITGDLSFEFSPSLSQESVNNVLNALADGVTDKSITFASTQYNYITEEQKAAATVKGWTIKSA